MDLNIIGNCIGSFALFFIAHIIIFRLIEEKTVITWLMRVYFLGLIFNVFGGLFVIRLDLFLIMFSGVLYTMTVFCYILGIFGLMESSIRIGLLVAIGEAKEGALGQKEILKIYNKKIIVARRLERFIASGELKKEGRYYLRNKKFSYFMLNDFILKILRRLY